MCTYTCVFNLNRPHFVTAMTSITVNVVSESESETVVPCPNIAVSIVPLSLLFVFLFSLLENAAI